MSAHYNNQMSMNKEASGVSGLYHWAAFLVYRCISYFTVHINRHPIHTKPIHMCSSLMSTQCCSHELHSIPYRIGSRWLLRGWLLRFGLLCLEFAFLRVLPRFLLGFLDTFNFLHLVRPLNLLLMQLFRGELEERFGVLGPSRPLKHCGIFCQQGSSPCHCNSRWSPYLQCTPSCQQEVL